EARLVGELVHELLLSHKPLLPSTCLTTAQDPNRLAGSVNHAVSTTPRPRRAPRPERGASAGPRGGRARRPRPPRHRPRKPLSGRRDRPPEAPPRHPPPRLPR